MFSALCCLHLSQIRICAWCHSDSSPMSSQENAVHTHMCSNIGVHDDVLQHRGAPLESCFWSHTIRCAGTSSDAPLTRAQCQHFFRHSLQPKQDSLHHQDSSLHVTHMTLSEMAKAVSCLQQETCFDLQNSRTCQHMPATHACHSWG